MKSRLEEIEALMDAAASGGDNIKYKDDQPLNSD